MGITDVVAGEVRAALARSSLKQSDLVAATGRSQTYWSKRLNGRQAFTVEDLRRVSDLTGVPVADLIGTAA